MSQYFVFDYAKKSIQLVDQSVLGSDGYRGDGDQHIVHATDFLVIDWEKKDFAYSHMQAVFENITCQLGYTRHLSSRDESKIKNFELIPLKIRERLCFYTPESIQNNTYAMTLQDAIDQDYL